MEFINRKKRELEMATLMQELSEEFNKIGNLKDLTTLRKALKWKFTKKEEEEFFKGDLIHKEVLAYSEYTSKKTLIKLAGGDETMVLKLLVGSLNLTKLSPYTIKRLIDEKGDLIGEAMAKNPDLPKVVAWWLAMDSNESIRANVAECQVVNYKQQINYPLLRQLIKDPSTYVINKLIASLGSNFFKDAVDWTKADCQFFPTDLYGVIKEIPGNLYQSPRNLKNFGKSANLKLAEEVMNNRTKNLKINNKDGLEPGNANSWFAWREKDDKNWEVIGWNFRKEKLFKGELELPNSVDGLFNFILVGNQITAKGWARKSGSQPFSWEWGTEDESGFGKRLKLPSNITPVYNFNNTKETNVTGNLKGVLMARGCILALWEDNEGNRIGWTEEERADLVPEKALIDLTKNTKTNFKGRELLPQSLWGIITNFDEITRAYLKEEITL